MKHLVVTAGMLALTLTAWPCFSQDVQTPFVGGPTYGRPDVVDTPESNERRAQARGSIKLFNTYNTVRSYQLDIGPIWHRQIQDETFAQRLTGFERGAPLASEIGLGMSYTTPSKPFFLVGRQRTILRIVDDKSFSWSLFHQDLGGGLFIGPFEPEAGVGLSVLTADIFHAEPSIQLLSPRVSAGVGLHLGRVRIDVKAHAEYLWRWFGPDYLIRGITLGVRLDVPRPASPYPVGPQ